LIDPPASANKIVRLTLASFTPVDLTVRAALIINAGHISINQTFLIHQNLDRSAFIHPFALFCSVFTAQALTSERLPFVQYAAHPKHTWHLELV
jgi:hypothetical protein